MQAQRGSSGVSASASPGRKLLSNAALCAAGGAGRPARRPAGRPGLGPGGTVRGNVALRIDEAGEECLQRIVLAGDGIDADTDGGELDDGVLGGVETGGLDVEGESVKVGHESKSPVGLMPGRTGAAGAMAKPGGPRGRKGLKERERESDRAGRAAVAAAPGSVAGARGRAFGGVLGGNGKGLQGSRGSGVSVLLFFSSLDLLLGLRGSGGRRPVARASTTCSGAGA